MNISKFSDSKTAHTCIACAEQRAENLHLLGIKNVIELCVGPSLKILETTYKKYNIDVVGNDIDKRWQEYYPKGKWIIGNALYINISSFDAVVFAPPLSKFCSGRRDEALSIDEVIPSYYEFLNLKNRVVVYVLPGKTLSIKEDRKQLHKLVNKLAEYKKHIDVIPLKNKVTKYVDVYGY